MEKNTQVVEETAKDVKAAYAVIKCGLVALALTALCLCAVAAKAAEIPKTEYLFDAALAADMLTTLDIKNQRNADGSWRTEEKNPLLGTHPSDARVVATCVAVAALHYAVTRELVNNDVPAPVVNAWEYITVGIETTAAVHNWSIGLRFTF